MAEGHRYPYSITLQNRASITPVLVGALSDDVRGFFVAEVDPSHFGDIQFVFKGPAGLRIDLYSRARWITLPEEGRDTEVVKLYHPVATLGRMLERKYDLFGTWISLLTYASWEGKRYGIQLVYGSGQRIDAYLELAYMT